MNNTPDIHALETNLRTREAELIAAIRNRFTPGVDPQKAKERGIEALAAETAARRDVNAWYAAQSARVPYEQMRAHYNVE